MKAEFYLNDEEYLCVKIGSDPNSVVDRLATDADRDQYRHAYAQWEDRHMTRFKRALAEFLGAAAFVPLSDQTMEGLTNMRDHLIQELDETPAEPELITDENRDPPADPVVKSEAPPATPPVQDTETETKTV